MQLSESRILIVDDQEANVRLLRQILSRAGYTNVHGTTDSRDVLKLWDQTTPDLVMLDLHMPHADGFTVLEDLRTRIQEAGYLPVLMMTGDLEQSVKARALSLGAKDFLGKPFRIAEVVQRITNLLETRALYRQLAAENRDLERRVSERTQALEEAQIEMLERLALASESRDDDTGEHTKRVGELSAQLARLAGWPENEIELVRRAAALHDIGKIGVPDRVLLKPGKLTCEEFELIKAHTVLGSRMLAGSRFRVIQLAEEVAQYHHEKWDGTGYLGLCGKDIPLVARIVGLADVFDVLTHTRPYKAAWPAVEALAFIERESGKHFDPNLVELLFQIKGAPPVGTPIRFEPPRKAKHAPVHGFEAQAQRQAC